MTLVTATAESWLVASAAVVSTLPDLAVYATVSSALVESAAILIVPDAGNSEASASVTDVAPAVNAPFTVDVS